MFLSDNTCSRHVTLGPSTQSLLILGGTNTKVTRTNCLYNPKHGPYTDPHHLLIYLQHLSTKKTAAVMSSPESEQIWIKSDHYHNSFLVPKDEVLDNIEETTKAIGIPDLAVSTAQGKFLHLLALSIGAKKILEVGTLGG